MKEVLLPSAIISILLLTASCGSKEKRPEGILDQKQMVSALTHVYIAEEKVRRLSLSTDSSQKVFNRLQEKVLSKAGVSDSLLKISIDYYQERPLELEQIYTTLVDSLNLMEQRETVEKRDTVKTE